MTDSVSERSAEASLAAMMMGLFFQRGAVPLVDTAPVGSVLLLFPDTPYQSATHCAVRLIDKTAVAAVCVIGGTEGVDTPGVQQQLLRSRLQESQLILPDLQSTSEGELRHCHYQLRGRQLVLKEVVVIAPRHKALGRKALVQTIFFNSRVSVAVPSVNHAEYLPKLSQDAPVPSQSERLASLLATEVKELQYRLAHQQIQGVEIPSDILALANAFCPPTLLAEPEAGRHTLC